MDSRPRVSVGLPVFNGENYLAEAIDSILAQTLADLELVICDNASTDRTEEICREYAASDARVRYHRNGSNIGPAPNFNLTFEYARGAYFKHAGHDDVLAPTYLERCVSALDAHPDGILCHSQTRVRSEVGEDLIEDLAGLDNPSPSERFAAVILRPHWTMDVHGVMRSEAFRRTKRLQSYYGADKALLAELALQGRLLRVEEPLFINRDHPQRSMRVLTFRQRLQFHDPSKAGQRVLPNWALYKDYCEVVGRHVADRRERLRCYRALARWWFANRHWARLGLDLVALTAPGLSTLAFRVRQRYRRGALGTR
jgi:glycosyltransferase involved in cell wall biosynthesis